jgi:hypothetical protein
MAMPARRLVPSDQPAPTLWSADDDTLQPVAPNPAEAAEHPEVVSQPATASMATATQLVPAAAAPRPRRWRPRTRRRS